MSALTETNEIKVRLAANRPRSLEIPGFRRAAVLVPLLDGEDGLELLLTVRSAKLSNHAGEIAFPGGRVEPGETDLQAALRETHEEVGLVVSPSEVLGRLSDHPSPAGYVATPLVARLPWPQVVTPDPAEVAKVFTVPLAALQAATPTTRPAKLSSYQRLLYSYPWGEYQIWGFTGNVIHDLLTVIAGGSAPSDHYELH